MAQTTNPGDLLNVRSYMQPKTGLSAVSLGIAGDELHGTSGYHIGGVFVPNDDYSQDESPRDNVNTTDASAFDVGNFPRLIELSNWLVGRCKQGDPKMRDVREIIYSPDGNVVKRWDRLGIRSTGDSSHLVHTHVSFFRNSIGFRDDDDNFLGALKVFFGDLTEGGTHPEDDETMSFTESGLVIPVSGRGSFSVGIIAGGAADPRPCWIDVWNSLDVGTEYALRMAGFTSAGAYAITCGTQLGSDGYNRKLTHATRGWAQLAPGTVGLEISRIPLAEGLQPYQGHLTFALEHGNRL